MTCPATPYGLVYASLAIVIALFALVLTTRLVDMWQHRRTRREIAARIAREAEQPYLGIGA